MLIKRYVLLMSTAPGLCKLGYCLEGRLTDSKALFCHYSSYYYGCFFPCPQHPGGCFITISYKNNAHSQAASAVMFLILVLQVSVQWIITFSRTRSRIMLFALICPCVSIYDIILFRNFLGKVNKVRLEEHM